MNLLLLLSLLEKKYKITVEYFLKGNFFKKIDKGINLGGSK